MTPRIQLLYVNDRSHQINAAFIPKQDFAISCAMKYIPGSLVMTIIFTFHYDADKDQYRTSVGFMALHLI